MRPILSPTEQADEVEQIARLARDDARLLRYTGTQGDFDQYLRGEKVHGWDATANPAPNDLMVGIVKDKGSPMLVSFSLIESVDGSTAIWDAATDVPIKPSVEWSTVLQSAAVPMRGVYDPPARRAIVDALITHLRSAVDVPEKEGEMELKKCRKRSQKNRIKALERAGGQCDACELNYRDLFGDRGDRALEVHHNVPLSERPTGIVETRLSDLTVLCASCHRLLHADPDRNLDALRSGWTLSE